MEKEEPPLRSHSKHKIRNIFITGVVTLFPLGLTIFIFKFVIELGGSIFSPIAKYIPVPKFITDLLGFVLLIVIIYLVGLAAKTFAGKVLFSWTTSIVTKLPLVRTIYNAAKELTDTFFLEKSAFKKVVIVEYPRHGCYSLAFLTNTNSWVKGYNTKGSKVDFYSVFVPTTPNPTSGYYLILPEDEFLVTDLTIEEGLRVIISGGTVMPKRKLEFDMKKYIKNKKEEGDV